MDNIYSKYDIPVPRYTSYPTVPHWNNSLTSQQWVGNLEQTFKSLPDWAMYLHIPFCETLCTFCGCTNIITKNHSKEMDYLHLLIKELDTYLCKIPCIRLSKLTQLHLGGGSPTFLSPENTSFLLKEIFQRVYAPNFVGSVEVDPRRCKTEHLKVYRDFDFKRISVGVQDFSPYVQKVINRHQTFEQTENTISTARRLGFTSVNIDLIYGLPLQTSETMQDSIEKTLILRPERVALYSYAKVPWIKPQQKLFKDSDLPQGLEKAALFRLARELLLNGGYREIGMDHFALPEDNLSIAQKNGKLNRNFMGYVDEESDVLLGLGLSSISDTGRQFHQNHKDLPSYTQSIENGDLPTFKGHSLSVEDLLNRKKIVRLMTQLVVSLDTPEEEMQAKDYLADMIQDGLVVVKDQAIAVTPQGKPFLRNICSYFDKYYRTIHPSKNVYSKSI